MTGFSTIACIPRKEVAVIAKEDIFLGFEVAAITFHGSRDSEDCQHQEGSQDVEKL